MRDQNPRTCDSAGFQAADAKELRETGAQLDMDQFVDISWRAGIGFSRSNFACRGAMD